MNLIFEIKNVYTWLCFTEALTQKSSYTMIQ